MTTRLENRHAQRGISLVEIMVALVISLVLVAGVGQIYISSKQTYRVQDSQSRLQENARYALEILTRAIREAGYRGCASTVPLTNALVGRTTVTPPAPTGGNSDYKFDYVEAIEGADWTAGTATTTTATNWTPSLDPDASITSPAAGSDIITIRTALDSGVTLQAAMTSETADLDVNPGGGLEQCDIVMVSDCQRAAVFQVTQITPNTPHTKDTLAHAPGTSCTDTHGTPGDTSDDTTEGPGNIDDGGSTNKLGKAFAAGANVFPFATISFYVRTSSKTQEPALYRKINGDNAEELIEGVENMQILYGEDTTPTAAPDPLSADRYVAAGSVTNWARIASVRISLLMRSSDNELTTTPQTYQFNGASVTATDRRLRHVFTTTIGLRNRLLN